MTALAVAAPEGLDLALRPMVHGDRAFVATSWLRSYEPISQIPKRVYLRHHPAIVDAILDASTTLIATSPSTPSVIHGFVTHAGPLIHFVYVARDLRRCGLGTWLVRAALGGEIPEVIDHTHRMPFVHRRGRFNPYHLGFPQ